MNKVITIIFSMFLAVGMFAQDAPVKAVKKDVKKVKTAIKKEPVKGAEQDIKEAIDQMDTDVQDGPFMEFEKMIVEYGTIDQHSEPLRVVKFTNTGNAPLVIKNARGSCGCTVPIWPKEPILPGEESVIEIRYDTKRLGKINKRVTITTNEVGVEPHVLQVIGEINKVDDQSVPSSAPSMLKGSN